MSAQYFEFNIHTRQGYNVLSCHVKHVFTLVVNNNSLFGVLFQVNIIDVQFILKLRWTDKLSVKKKMNISTGDFRYIKTQLDKQRK